VSRLCQDDMKLLAARYALSFIEDGFTVGVGSGSTAMIFLRLLAEKIKRGELSNITLVPTSTEVEYNATRLGVEKNILQPWQVDKIDVAVDGADEVTPSRDLLKGCGGALTGEKIVDYAADKLIIIVDETKLVDKLGSRHPVPVEVLPRAWRLVSRTLESRFGGEARLRVLEHGKRGPLVTDNGCFLVDWYRSLSEDPEVVEREVKSIVGVVEVGIFPRSHVYKVIVAHSDGTVTEI